MSMLNRIRRFLSGRTNQTNSFEIQLPSGDRLMGHLTAAGDLYLQFSESSMYRIPGHCIAPLAHWLGGVQGKFSWVRPASSHPRAVVIPFTRTKLSNNRTKGLNTYEEWLSED